MTLSVIILNYNVKYFLELCLKSVQAAIKDIDAEIIVVDNNSKDESCLMVTDLFPSVKLIENKENLGFSKGNNIGVKLAKGQYICILNPDTVVAEDTFSKLLEFCTDKDDLGAVGCKLINGNGNFLPESKRNVPLVKAAFKKMIGNSESYYANHLKENEVGEVDVLVGAFMFMKKHAYEKVGGFDEDYFMYGEDIDLSYSLLKANYKNYYFGKSTVIHFKGESTLRDKQYAKRFYGAMQIFYKKHFKQNVLFDALVWFGIKFAYVLRKASKHKLKSVNRFILVSNNKVGGLETLSNKKIHLDKNIKGYEEADELILDANFLTYKKIISFIEEESKKNKVTFKILPNNAKFIIGSDDAVSRGEVFQF